MKTIAKPLLLLILTLGVVTFASSQQVEPIDSTKVQAKPEAGTKLPLNPELSFYSSYDNILAPSHTVAEPIDLNLSRHFEAKNIYAPFFAYSYSFDNPLQQGYSNQGLFRRFDLTDFLSSDVNVFISSAYFGEIQPYRYVNGSIYANLKVKILDRVKLVGEGQISVREGLDPKLPTAVGGANFYGAGIEFKVAPNVGIGFGVRHYYYKGEWSRRTYTAPTSW